MNSKKEVQHVYLVGAKSLGAYGGYETFVYKLTEYHQNKENIKYHVACKANGDGCMDESKFDGVTKINDHEFEFHNAHCFKIDVPQIGPAQAIYYDIAALKACCEHMLNEFIEKILVHERDRKGSIQTTQEVEIYFNFVGRFVPPAFGEVELTPEELEEIRKREERKDRLHQNYLKRKANGKQKEYEERTKAKKKAEIEARKQAIRTEDIARGVFIPVSSLPQLGPRKGA